MQMIPTDTAAIPFQPSKIKVAHLLPERKPVMDNKIEVFKNEQFGEIRTALIENEPWFVAVDVCRALEIGNSSQAISRLDADEKMITLISNEGNKRGNPNMTVVNEPGLYTLILSSRKPEAKAFKRWITHDVIPMIRKTGCYMTDSVLERIRKDPTFTYTVKKIVAPYFREKEVTLKNLTAKDIQEFYLSELERVSPSSVIHYHANIHKALKYAVKIDLIDVNPADKVERPKKDRYVGSFYDADEVNALFEAAKGSKLELPILFGAFYGLRRSEAIGLKWDAIDFDQNTITIRHTVTSCDLDGKRVLVASDTTKTKSSMRTLPLVPFMRERLLTLKEEQQENRRLCGRSYIKDYLEYVCVNEIGDLIKPHYVTESFPKLLKAKGMRQIRYHDLRHSCASLLLANGVPMKQIQEWLGHSDFSTTANIYAHLDYSSKLTSADAMLNGLGFAAN